MKILSLGYLGFKSPRYKEWSEFGPEILGLQRVDNGEDGSVRLRMDDRNHRIAIHPGEIDEVAYMGWDVRGREEFEAALIHLADKGYPATMATEDELENRRVAGMAWVVDPAGFRHEIFHGQQHVPMPFYPGRPISGFVAGDLGIGHCVLVVPEITRALQDFATQVMGFYTHWPLGNIDIYACNVRSHCLLYLPIPGMRGMEHFYLDLKHMDDVGRAYDLCRERGIVQREFGRYAQDDDLSFYLRSPAGVDIQYATGAKLNDGPIPWTSKGIMIKHAYSLVWGHHVLIPEPGSMIRPVAK